MFLFFNSAFLKSRTIVRVCCVASEAPSTAFLSGRLSRALEQAGGRWAGTRLNWAVQSAAADFLHLMLVCMTHLAPHARSDHMDYPQTSPCSV